MDKKKREKRKKLGKKVSKEYNKFWARKVTEDGLALTPVLRYTDFGVFPFIDIFEATDEHKKRAKEILSKRSVIEVPKKGLEGLGK